MILKFFLLTLCTTSLLFSQAEETRLTPVENVLNQIIEIPVVEKDKQDEFCSNFLKNQEKLKNTNPHLSNLVNYSKDVYDEVCSVLKDASDSSSFPDIPIDSLIWDRAPQCKLDDPAVKFCDFTHFKNKGIFVYKDEESENYLVCGTAHGKRDGLFRDRYFIDSKCKVSNVNWDDYIDNGTNNSVRGSLYEAEVFFRWFRTPSKYSALQVPNLLAKQCKAAFPNAKFCIPTLIIIPTANPHVFDECHLETKRLRVDALFIHYSKRHSKWVCKSHDLTKVVVEDQHKSKGCVPSPAGRVLNSRNPHGTTTTGQISKGCRLPYIPQTY
jgi:hypothetical protein